MLQFTHEIQQKKPLYSMMGTAPSVPAHLEINNYPGFFGSLSRELPPFSFLTNFSLLRLIEARSLLKEPLRFRDPVPSWKKWAHLKLQKLCPSVTVQQLLQLQSNILTLLPLNGKNKIISLNFKQNLMACFLNLLSPSLVLWDEHQKSNEKHYLYLSSILPDTVQYYPPHATRFIEMRSYTAPQHLNEAYSGEGPEGLRTLP